ncbi:IS66 family transposase [Nitrospirillum viridazoti]
MADLEENARRQAAGKKTITLSLIAIEVVRRIDALFDIERPINGKSADERRAVRQELSKPLVEDLWAYFHEQRAKLSRGHDLAKAIERIWHVVVCSVNHLFRALISKAITVPNTPIAPFIAVNSLFWIAPLCQKTKFSMTETTTRQTANNNKFL